MIDKKTVDVYAMFNDELNAIKKELTQKLVALPASHPKYAGQAHWARMLKRGIERSMTVCRFLFLMATEAVGRCIHIITGVVLRRCYTLPNVCIPTTTR